MDELGATWRRTKAQLGKIEQFKKLQSTLADTDQRLHQAKDRVALLKAQIAQTPQPTRTMRNELARAQREVGLLSEKLEAQRWRLNAHRKAMKALGLETASLAEQQKKLGAVFEKVDAAQLKLSKARAGHDNLLGKQSQLHSQVLGTAALGLTFAVPIRIAVDFEQSIAKLGAITGAEGESLKALEKQARNLGASTVFTASEAASAMTYLGMAGFKTNEILAATPGVLNLAQAAGADLAETADIASNILSGFNLEARETGRVGDVLAKAMTTSNVNLQQLGETMKYVAPAASSVGASLEEVAALSGLLGNVGIQGSNAGTALRAAFLRLAKPPREAAEALNQLGVSIKTADGKMRSMPAILKDIWAATQDMGDADRIAVLTKLFGVEAASAMAELVRQAGTGALDTYVQTLKNAKGATAEMAEKMNATTQGALRRLGSAIESLSITLGSLLLPVVADGAELISHAATAVAQFADAHPILTKVVLGTVAALVALKISALAGGLALNSLKLSVSSLTLAHAHFKAQQALLPLYLQRSRKAVTALSAAYTALTTRITLLGTVHSKAMPILAAGWGKALTGISALRTAVMSLGAVIMATPVGWLLAAGAALTAVGITVYKHWSAIKAFFSGIGQGIGDALREVGPAGEVVIGIGRVIGSVFSTVGEAIGWVFKQIGSFFDWIARPAEYSQQQLQGVADKGRTVGRVLGTVFKVLLSPVTLLLAGLKRIWAMLTRIGQGIKGTLGSAWKVITGLFGGGEEKTAQTGETQPEKTTSSLWGTVKSWFGNDEKQPQKVPPATHMSPVKAIAMGAAIGTAMPVAAQPQPVTAVAPAQQQTESVMRQTADQPGKKAAQISVNPLPASPAIGQKPGDAIRLIQPPAQQQADMPGVRGGMTQKQVAELAALTADPVPDTGTRNLRPSIAPVPPPAATQSVVNNHHVDNSTIQITVQQQLGEDAEMLSRRVMEEMQRHKMRSEWDIE